MPFALCSAVNEEISSSSDRAGPYCSVHFATQRQLPVPVTAELEKIGIRDFSAFFCLSKTNLREFRLEIGADKSGCGTFGISVFSSLCLFIYI